MSTLRDGRQSMPVYTQRVEAVQTDFRVTIPHKEQNDTRPLVLTRIRLTSQSCGDKCTCVPHISVRKALLPVTMVKAA